MPFHPQHIFRRAHRLGHRAWWLMVTCISAAIVAGGVLLLLIPSRAHVDVNRNIFPVKGIDISWHNGEIDFPRVKKAGVDFAFVKATEGESYRDPMFETNFEGARNAGIPVGAYHFFRFDCDGAMQARNLLTALADRPTDLPVAIDVEDYGNPEGYDDHNIALNLREMIDILSESGRKVLIYSNKKGYERYVRNNFDNLPVWVCSFSGPPVDEINWTLWQHSHLSRIDGIDSPVDLNTFNGDRKSFQSWLQSLNG